MTASAFQRIAARVRKARNLPPGARLHHLAGPVYNRVPAPFVLYAGARLDLRPGELAARFHEARRAPVTRRVLDSGVLTEASGNVGMVPAAVLYALVRVLRPETVVETGVAAGLSSAYMLSALDANRRGRLVSIDLPFTEAAGRPAPIVEGTTIDVSQWSPIPPDRSHGWLVPEELRGRWDLRMGDARELLPPALEELGEVDVFLHDSLHTLEHMLFEFETAWPHIRPGGLLATDDLGRRGVDPLQRFAKRVGRPFVVLGGMGFIRKPG